jgi:hypothetical protein
MKSIYFITMVPAGFGFTKKASEITPAKEGGKVGAAFGSLAPA